MLRCSRVFQTLDGISPKSFIIYMFPACYGIYTPAIKTCARTWVCQYNLLYKWCGIVLAQLHRHNTHTHTPVHKQKKIKLKSETISKLKYQPSLISRWGMKNSSNADYITVLLQPMWYDASSLFFLNAFHLVVFFHWRVCVFLCRKDNSELFSVDIVRVKSRNSW